MSDDERPLAVDLFSGLGGWAEGLIAEGWRVRAYDIEDMYAATGATMHDHYELVLRDVLDMHGSEIADAQLIVSSSPCTEYSWMAMPWSLAKAKAAGIRADKTGEALRRLNALFNAQFRLQREASEVAGRPIPMVVENVRGAQPWVGRAAGSYGSYYLWGDVPAMLPEPVDALKVPGFRFDGVTKKCFQQEAADRMALEGQKSSDAVWPAVGGPGAVSVGEKPSHALRRDGIKGSEGYERDYPNAFRWKKPGTSSGSKARKAASAKVAKIPFTLSRHIGKVFHPNSTDKLARVREIDLFSNWG